MIVDFVNGKKVCSGIRRLKRHEVEFDNGKTERFDAIILATGYKSNVPSWLKVLVNNDNIVILPLSTFFNKIFILIFLYFVLNEFWKINNFSGE